MKEWLGDASMTSGNTDATERAFEPTAEHYLAASRELGLRAVLGRRMQMESIRKLIAVATFIFAATLLSFGSDIYVAQTAAGANSGADCADAYALSFAANSSNWGSGAAQIGPGTTLHLCGTITGAAGATGLTVQGSGTSTNPLTIKFEPGAVMTAPYWNAAISINNHSYVVVDGGTNGTIQNTANGTSLSYHSSSDGVYGANCTYCRIQNLTIKNMYINQGSSSSASDTNGAGTMGIEIDQNSTGSIINNNTISDSRAGIDVSPDGNGDASNVQIYGNSISDMSWGMVVGGGDASDTINNLSIHDNTITNWTNWQFPTATYHQDGIILFNVGNPTAGLTANIYNNYIYGNLGVGSPTGFIYCADFSSCTIYNNVLVNTGNVIYGMMWLGQSSDMGKNMSVYNNTMVDTASSGAICIMLNITQKATIENNICTGPTGTMGLYSTYLGSLSSFEGVVTTSNYNDWNTGTSGWGSQLNGSTATYSSWTGAGYEKDSTQANPNLTSTYTLSSGSPAIGMGTNLTSLGIATLNVDRAGVARPSTGAWDVGAYQYGASTTAPAAPAAPTGVTAIVN